MSQWRLIRSSGWDAAIPEADPEGRWLHLIIDAESSANVLSEDVLTDLSSQIDDIGNHQGVDAVIVSSAKQDHFIAGADVNAIGSAENVDQVVDACRRAQDLFGRLSSLSIPSIAVIRGTCLGGGLELSLGCTARIGVSDPRTRIGFPEVNLGIIPGFGGTVRLTRLLGLRASLGWILPASRLPAPIAYRKGVLDATVPTEGFRELSLQLIEQMVSDGFRSVRARRKKRRKGFFSYLLDETTLGRTIVCKKALKTVRARTLGHMPAPEKAIEVARLSAHKDERHSLEMEAMAVSRLATGPVCRNLVSIFQDSERVRRGTDGDPDGSWPEDRSLMILGAGVMGSGVATIAIEKSIPVRLRDISLESLDRALKLIGSAIDQRRKKRRFTRYQQAEILSRLGHGKDLIGLGRCAGVLEAVVERLDVKRSVLAEVAPLLGDEAIFATNTSALSVTEIQHGSPIASRVVGLHFFNPVPRMPLVEVIPGEQTAPETVGIALALARKLGKYPVLVKDSPGFLVNRLLLPYLDAASRLLLDGVSGAHIDAVARRHGLPMGPFRLMDEVGLDIGFEVQETLHASFGERAAASPMLQKMVEKGWLGKKAGIGFYLHRGTSLTWNQQVKTMIKASARTMSDVDIISSLLDPMVDEAARCLEENVVLDAGILDLAMVMGTGYPPHLGGPLRAADSEGLPQIEKRLRAAHEAGSARSPCDLLVELASKNAGFHSQTRN
ncbi:MAG: fatty-acid oxidation protein subunit alpha [Bacillota bacterium]|nr:MAG: fatty-acid oxidation protein subunit alpha [Planctomycetota bacterium]RUA09808.1 MAG: fatty-acid oxidation protein subunit alpha [Bacillota bacterium]